MSKNASGFLCLLNKQTLSAHFVYLKSLDVICQFKKDGTIIPLKIRLQDEDGEYQSYMVKSYRQSGVIEYILSSYIKSPLMCRLNLLNNRAII